MNLTPNEKRDLIKLIESDKPLPDGFRFKLFADKREVELVWNGKSWKFTDMFYEIIPSSVPTAPGCRM